MHTIIAQLVGGAKDGDSVIFQSDNAPLLLRVRTNFKREAVYKKVQRFGLVNWRYEFYDYWNDKIELVEETPDN